MSTRIRELSIKRENNNDDDDVKKHENVNGKDKENRKSQKINQIINKFLPVVNYYYLTKTEATTATADVDVDSLLNKNNNNNNRENNSISSNANVNLNDFQIRKQKKRNKIKKKTTTTAEVNSNNSNNNRKEEEEEEIQKINIDIELEQEQEEEEGKNFNSNHHHCQTLTNANSRKFLNYYCHLKDQNQLGDEEVEEENLHLLIEEAAACLHPKKILGSGFRISNNTTSLSSTSTKTNTKLTRTHYKHLWDAILLHNSHTNGSKLKTLNNVTNSSTLNPQQLLPIMTSSHHHHSSNITAPFPPNATRPRANEAKFSFFQNNPNTNAASFLLSPADQQKKRFDLNRLMLKNRIYSSLNANANFNSNIKSNQRIFKLPLYSHLNDLLTYYSILRNQAIESNKAIRHCKHK
jgi:hypothetical protein